MRTINACLVIMITILGFTTSFDFASINEIQSLKQNSFASSLIETISLSLQADKANGAEDVLKMLNDLQTQLNNDQQNDDVTFNAKNAAYNAHIAKLTAAINVLITEINDLTARILVLDGLITQAGKNIQSFTNRILNLNLSLKDLDTKLVEDTKYYTEKANGLAALNVKLLLVNQTLKKMIGSASGKNVQSHIALTESEKRDIAYRNEQNAQRLKKSFVQISKEFPLATNLAELYLQADQKALKKLMGIIKRFADDALVQKANAEQRLVDAKATHAALTKQMLAEIAANTAARAKQEANKKAYEAERVQKIQLRREKTERKEALEKEREINRNLQANLNTTYQREKADRAEEGKIVATLVRIVKTRLMKTQ